MKTLSKSFPFLLLSIFLLSCGTEKKIELFNGENLDNWDVYVSNPDVAPGDLFWVNEGVINTSGIPNGYIRTKEIYSNFKLHVEWRWNENPSNSGVLIHVQGKEMIWPLCIECQLMHEHAGDVVLIGKGSGITSRDSSYLITSEENRYKVIPRFEELSENTPGEWNSYDITSKDGDLEVVVNGVLQHLANGMTLTEGNIALQSEGAPLQFRNIYLQPL